MEEKKPSVTIERYVDEVLIKDTEIFGIVKNDLCNRVFMELKSEKSQNLDKQSTRTVRFNFQKKNKIYFEDYMKGKGAKTESEVLRDMFTHYANMPQYQRERIIEKKKFDTIKKSIKSQRKLRIITLRGERIIKPYFIAHNREEEFNYLVCSKENEEKIINYRIMNIVELIEIENRFEMSPELSREVKRIKENYDPFFSGNSNIKVRFSIEGIELLKTVVHNRPKIINPKSVREIKAGEIIEFECSERKAIAYFMQFGAWAEVVEPAVIREKFVEIYRCGYDKYRG